MWNQKRTDRVAMPPILGMPRQLRIDPEMGKRIRAEAALNRRTIQAELLYRIEISLTRPKMSNFVIRRRRMPAKKKPIQHGTTYAYTVHCCRCAPCRAANSTYMRNYRKQTEAKGGKNGN
jgi:hypothetical protein